MLLVLVLLRLGGVAIALLEGVVLANGDIRTLLIDVGGVDVFCERVLALALAGLLRLAAAIAIVECTRGGV